MLRSSRARENRLEPLAAKVPEITALFWVIKILTTGMGEAMSDFLGQTSVPLAGVDRVFGALSRSDCSSAAAVPGADLLVRGDDGRGLRDDGRRRHA